MASPVREKKALCVLSSEETQFQNEIFKYLPECTKTISKVSNILTSTIFSDELGSQNFKIVSFFI